MHDAADPSYKLLQGVTRYCVLSGTLSYYPLCLSHLPSLSICLLQTPVYPLQPTAAYVSAARALLVVGVIACHH